MASCCRSRNGSVTGTHAACSHGGSKGSAVDLLTAKALLTEMALRHLAPVPLYFCQEPTCSVVYFTTDRQVYTRTDVRVPVWQKEPDGGRTICYCFDENEGSMVRELVETGRCGAVHRVRDHQQAQALGLTLKDVKELVANEGRGGHQRCGRVRDLLKIRLADVDARIREMQAFRRTLRSHLSDCERALEQERPVCPVMIELGGRGQ